ncbi:MAG: GNAT family N-acetyltransferase [Gemmatimonadaceae bacterium]
MRDTIDIGGSLVTIDPLDRGRHAVACARMMSSSEPWITLGRTYEQSLAVIDLAGQEAYAALDEREQPIGLLLLMLQGTLVGYVRSLLVHPARRSRGVGAALMDFAERRIRRVSPNVFVMVSSFNPAAQRFYERQGYVRIGELSDSIVRGHSEILLRKSAGPWGVWTLVGGG